MQAVISLLDEYHRQRVVSVWEELKREFHIRATSERVPCPHMTYQGALSYEEMPLTGHFTVQTSKGKTGESVITTGSSLQRRKHCDDCIGACTAIGCSNANACAR